jgi:hypothetical protein
MIDDFARHPRGKNCAYPIEAAMLAFRDFSVSVTELVRAPE